MKIKKFNNLQELDLIKKYIDYPNNDYLNYDNYVRNFENLYYINEKNLYILIKRKDYYKTYYYLKDKDEIFNAQGVFVSEIVGKNPTNDLVDIGFKLYKTRVRMRLKTREEFYSERVKFIDDIDFLYRAIGTFDKYSGEILTREEIRDKILRKEFIGIDNIGFIEFEKTKFQDSILHFYVEAKLRNQGFGSEILKHYLSNIVDKKRVGVWTDFDSKAIKTYERAGFKKENLKSYVYIGGEVNNDRKN